MLRNQLYYRRDSAVRVVQSSSFFLKAEKKTSIYKRYNTKANKKSVQNGTSIQAFLKIKTLLQKSPLMQSYCMVQVGTFLFSKKVHHKEATLYLVAERP